MHDRLRVGIVGCGGIANIRHIPGFKKLDESVVIQAVCDKNSELALETAKNHSISAAYTELSEEDQSRDYGTYTTMADLENPTREYFDNLIESGSDFLNMDYVRRFWPLKTYMEPRSHGVS
jgi:predicted dinucleotide-utilizing enzyme